MKFPADRARWLYVVYELERKLGRPPHASDLAAHFGTSTETHNATIRSAKAERQVRHIPRTGNYDPCSVRLTPAAIVELGLPALVYLAWPMADGDPDRATGLELAQWLYDVAGMVGVSPWLATAPASMTTARLMAERCEAAVVWRDPLLLGREDVASALRHNVVATVLQAGDREYVRSARDLWIPPFLVPQKTA